MPKSCWGINILTLSINMLGTNRQYGKIQRFVHNTNTRLLRVISIMNSTVSFVQGGERRVSSRTVRERDFRTVDLDDGPSKEFMKQIEGLITQSRLSKLEKILNNKNILSSDKEYSKLYAELTDWDMEGYRILVSLPNGRVIFDSSRGASNTKENASLCGFGKIRVSRANVMVAQLSLSGIGFERDFENTETGKSDVKQHIVFRIGPQYASYGFLYVVGTLNKTCGGNLCTEANVTENENDPCLKRGPIGPKGDPGPIGPEGPPGGDPELSTVLSFQSTVKECCQVAMYIPHGSNSLVSGSAVFIRKGAIQGTLSADTTLENNDDLFVLTSAHNQDPDDLKDSTINRNLRLMVTYFDTDSEGNRTGVIYPWAYSNRLDLMLCKFTSDTVPNNPIRGVLLEESSSLRTGMPVFVIGNTLGLDEFSFTTGHIREANFAKPEFYNSSTNTFSNVPPTFVIRSGAKHGNSGGGVFSRVGQKLLGIVSFGMTGADYSGVTHPITMSVALKRMILETNEDNYPLRLPLSFTNTSGSYLGASTNLYIQSNGFKFDNQTNAVGMLYVGKLDKSRDFALDKGQFKSGDVITQIDTPNKIYSIGAGFPYLPLDFIQGLVPPNTTVTVRAKRPVDGVMMQSDINVTVKLPELPEKLDFMQSSK